MELSCKRYNADLTVLGYNQEWKGFAWRFSLLQEYLDNQLPNEIICFIDAYDVMLLRDPNKMEELFKKFKKLYNTKIIVAEDKASPLIQFFLGLTFGKCGPYNINAGTYIGEAKDIKNMINDIKKIDNNITADDQVLLTKYCNNNMNKIKIDINSDFFCTLTNKNKINIKNGKLYYKNKLPFLLHCPGNTNIESIIKKLGYTITEEDQKVLKKFHTQSFMKKIYYTIKTNRLNLILLSILISIIILYYLKQ